MKTVEEARQCVCPQLSCAVGEKSIGWQIMHEKCQADECMMWRKEMRHYDGVAKEMCDTGKGYCGLAGKP